MVIIENSTMKAPLIYKNKSRECNIFCNCISLKTDKFQDNFDISVIIHLKEILCMLRLG